MAAGLVLGGAATALAQEDDSLGPVDPDARVPVLNREGPLEKSLQVDRTRRQYERTYDDAEKLEVEPQRNVAEAVARHPELRSELAGLRETVRRAEAEARRLARRQARREAAKPDFDTPESVGVSTATLESIAACESGGDPAIVSSDGTYRGKYQFDYGTWAAVGGSGDPAAAPEAEQDYRAALLYSQSGAAPWPVCG